MSSDEEYLDDLLKSIVEDEGESEDSASGESLMGAESSSMDDLDFAIEDTESLTDFALDSAAMEASGEGEELAAESGDEELFSDFAIEDLAMEDEPQADFRSPL